MLFGKNYLFFFFLAQGGPPSESSIAQISLETKRISVLSVLIKTVKTLSFSSRLCLRCRACILFLVCKHTDKSLHPPHHPNGIAT